MGKTYHDLSFRLYCKLETLLHLAADEEGSCEEGSVAWCPRLAGRDWGASGAPVPPHFSRVMADPSHRASVLSAPCLVP